MKQENLTLTAADYTAIELEDAAYLNNKGAGEYNLEHYAAAAEYYRLAAAMGNAQAVSNLGYCYLYGRDMEQNTSLAVANFKIAARRENVDAAYKLGDIYSSDKWGVRDTELSVYYFRMAASFILGEEWENSRVISCSRELERYPSLCFAMGRELSAGGAMATDLESAYRFLKKAEAGYRRELLNGAKMYAESFDGVTKLLNDPKFDAVREKIENEENGFYEDD